MAASMHAQLCMPCNHMTAGCSLMAPAAHSLTRALGTAGSGRSRKGRKVCRAIATPGYSVGSEDAGFSYEIPSLTEEGLGLGQSLSLSCSLEGCSLSQTYAPGFTLQQGNGWRLGYEASPACEDDFCATIGGDKWSLALTARQFHEFCHLFKVLTKAMENSTDPLHGSLMLTGSTVFVEGRITSQEDLEDWREIRHSRPFLQVHVGLTSSKQSSIAKSRGGYWEDLAVSEMMDKAPELFWSSTELQSSMSGALVPLASVGETLGTVERVSTAAGNVAAESVSVVEGSTATAVREQPSAEPREGENCRASEFRSSSRRRKKLDTSGPITGYSETLKNFWFPVAFSKDLDEKKAIPFDCFEQSWVIFRDSDGTAGCIKDACAHRSCPLSLGTVDEGKIVCPYHGWEFDTSGKCTKMPSTRITNVSVKSIPCVEKQGLIWVWPGKGQPDDVFPDTMPPSDYVVHAEIVIDLPVEHGLLVENLLDLAHAPFTHTSTFAKGWSVPNLVRFKTPQAALALKGHWDPYPIAMEFRPPCVVVSTIGLVKPGQLDASSQSHDCQQHLFQLHACIPSSRGSTRLLYRMGLDFAQWVKHVPLIQHLWMYLANQVLDEDLRLVLGQQERMKRGSNVWNHPVVYDKLGVNYRRWRNNVEEEDLQINT